jgi:hypothetical protein
MAAPTVQAFLRKLIDDAAKTIFSDDELQAQLDLHKTHVLYEFMQYDENRKRFWTGNRYLTDAKLYDSSDEDDQTEYTPTTTNLLEGWFEFSAEQTVTLYLKAYSYNVYAAASDCWLTIATTKWEMFSNMIGGTQETLSQQYDHALKQHEYYRRMAYPPKAGRAARLYD